MDLPDPLLFALGSGFDSLLFSVWSWLGLAFELPVRAQPLAAQSVAPFSLTLACVGLALAVWALCVARCRLQWAAARCPAVVALGAPFSPPSSSAVRAGWASWMGRLLPAGG